MVTVPKHPKGVYLHPNTAHQENVTALTKNPREKVFIIYLLKIQV